MDSYLKKKSKIIKFTRHWELKISERLPYYTLDQAKNRIMILLARNKANLRYNKWNKNYRLYDLEYWVVYAIWEYFEVITVMLLPIKTSADVHYKKINRLHKIQFLKERWLNLEKLYHYRSKWLQ